MFVHLCSVGAKVERRGLKTRRGMKFRASRSGQSSSKFKQIFRSFIYVSTFCNCGSRKINIHVQSCCQSQPKVIFKFHWLQDQSFQEKFFRMLNKGYEITLQFHMGAEGKTNQESAIYNVSMSSETDTVAES